jgi:hypothetical protein
MDEKESKNEWRREAYRLNVYGDKDIIQCYCGSTTVRNKYWAHLRTKKHVHWLAGDQVIAEKKDPSYLYIHERR